MVPVSGQLAVFFSLVPSPHGSGASSSVSILVYFIKRRAASSILSSRFETMSLYRCLASWLDKYNGQPRGNCDVPRRNRAEVPFIHGTLAARGSAREDGEVRRKIK